MNRFLGSNVVIFTDGGWEVRGLMEMENETSYFLIDNGEFVEVIKSKVSLIKRDLVSKKRSDLYDSTDLKAEEKGNMAPPGVLAGSKKKLSDLEKRLFEAQEKKSESQEDLYTASIPQDLLLPSDEDKEEDLSISF